MICTRKPPKFHKNPTKSVGEVAVTSFANGNSKSKRAITLCKSDQIKNSKRYAHFHIKARKLAEFHKYLTKYVGVADTSFANGNSESKRVITMSKIIR